MSGAGPFGRGAGRPGFGEDTPRREFLRVAGAGGIAALLIGGIAVRMYRDLQLRRTTATRIKMGTPVTLTLFHDDEESAARAADIAFGEIDRLEAIFSRYRPESPVSRLGRNGVLMDAPPELVDVLRRSARFSELTDGAFDVTIAPVLDLYRTRTAAGGAPPEDPEIAEALALVNHRDLRVDGTTVSLAEPGMAITLDAIAKGYVMDRVLATLAATGVARAMVEAGGDLAASVEPDGEPWEVAIQDPRRGAGSIGTFLVGEPGATRGVATSGDYMDAFTPDRSLHHIIDPRTGRSPRELSSATVIAGSATDADALATSAVVLGQEAGLEFLEEIAGVEGFLVTRNGQEIRTSGFPPLD